MDRVVRYSGADEDIRRQAAEAVLELRSEDPPKTYKQCARIVRDEEGIELTRNNIYNIITKAKEEEEQSRTVAKKRLKEQRSKGGPLPFEELDGRTKDIVKRDVISIRRSKEQVRYREIVEEIKKKLGVSLTRGDVDSILLQRVQKLEEAEKKRKTVERRSRVRDKKVERKPPKIRTLSVDTGEEGVKNLDYKICNVVFSGTIDAAIDIDTFIEHNGDASYDPHKFPGIVVKLEDPVTSMLVFKTGKWVSVGLNDADQIGRVKQKLHQRILRSGINLPEDGIRCEIKNIVLTTELPDETERLVDLNLLALQLECCMYEPEVFPGLIYKDRNGGNIQRAVFLIFSSKKVVCVGIRDVDSVEDILADFTRTIASLGDRIYIERISNQDIPDDLRFLDLSS
jgi:transcription initiation factor TFIID TATA-box-binding protein